MPLSGSKPDISPLPTSTPHVHHHPLRITTLYPMLCASRQYAKPMPACYTWFFALSSAVEQIQVYLGSRNSFDVYDVHVSSDAWCESYIPCITALPQASGVLQDGAVKFAPIAWLVSLICCNTVMKSLIMKPTV